MNEKTQEALLRIRRVEGPPCERCKGMGGRMYGSGSTWRGGMGTTMCAWDVCDECWGSGDKTQPWTNQREQVALIERLRTESSVRWLAHSVGAELDNVRPYLARISAVVEKEARRRKVEGVDRSELFWYFRVVEIVAGALGKMAIGRSVFEDRPTDELADLRALKAAAITYVSATGTCNSDYLDDDNAYCLDSGCTYCALAKALQRADEAKP